MPPLFQSYNTISLAVHAQLDSVLRLWQRRLGPDLLAVYLHGRCGDMAEEVLTDYGITPTDILRAIPAAIRELLS